MPSHSQRDRRRDSPSDSVSDQYSYDSNKDSSKRSHKRTSRHTEDRRRSSQDMQQSSSSSDRSDRSTTSESDRNGSGAKDRHAKSVHGHTRSERYSRRARDERLSKSELERLATEEMKQEEQSRAKWIQSRNLLREAQIAAIRNQRQPRKDPLLSRPVLGAAEEAAATSRAGAAITQQLHSLVQDIASFRAGKLTSRNIMQSDLRTTGRARQIDQYVADQLEEMGIDTGAAGEGAQGETDARKTFTYYILRMNSLLAGQSPQLVEQYTNHLKKAYRVAKLREKILALEQSIRAPPAEAQARRGLNFDAGLAIDLCQRLLQAVREAVVTPTEYTELNVRITNTLQLVGAIQTSRAGGELVEGRFPWLRKPAFAYYEPRSSVALVDGQLGCVFLPSFGLAKREKYDIQLRGRFLECVRTG